MKNRDWWKNKVAYEIYPRSYKDTNGDGVGDLRGIIEKLDYLKDLGVDIIWICPVYCSPMADGGYDISDYQNIDPLFGNMDDMDELIKEADKRGIKILMDLVLNHCSDEHEWFKKALADPNCEEAGYFYFREGEDGNPPNNWRSLFGGSAWEPIGDGRWYLHLFAKKQPDLNWENPILRDKLYNMIRWWLDKGLGGFRIDAITHIKKEETLASLPPDADGFATCFPSALNYPGIGDFLTELRKETFDRYECMTVGEASGVPMKQIGEYIGKDGYFDAIFDFTYAEPYSVGYAWHQFYRNGEWSFDDWREKIYDSQLKTQEIGYGAVFLENHDYPRAMSRFLPKSHHSKTAQKMLATLLFSLRGIPFIYQGEELGIDNPTFKTIEEIEDISTNNQYRVALADGLTPEEALSAVCFPSRENARIPMVWDESENWGFSTAKPWSTLHDRGGDFCVARAMQDPDSVYHFYRELIRMRKSEAYGDTVVFGRFAPILETEDRLLAFTRKGETQKLAVICSFSDKARTVELPEEGSLLLANGAVLSGKTLSLEPCGSAVIEIL